MSTDRRVELADARGIGYAETGDPDGPPVIHFHGNPGSRLEVAGLRPIAEDLGIRLIGPERPGIGLSPFEPFTVREYPQQVQRLADALGLDRFAVTGLSSGGKYACACAWYLPDRVSHVALISSTCPRDLPGARATPNKSDRVLNPLAARAPWLVQILFAKLAHDARRNPASLLSMLDDLGPDDQAILEQAEFRENFERSLTEAFRQGGRGVAHEYAIEGRPWNVPLDQIDVPVHIWHGQDDRLVSPQASRILAEAIPHATTHFVPGAGHLMFARYASDILQSAL